jgi:hypothetical protein
MTEPGRGSPNHPGCLSLSIAIGLAGNVVLVGLIAIGLGVDWAVGWR